MNGGANAADALRLGGRDAFAFLTSKSFQGVYRVDRELSSTKIPILCST